MSMTSERIAIESYNLLLRVLTQVFALHEKGNLRHAFIYRHAQTILRLGEDLFHLEAERRSYSSPIVVRVMLECLFNLAAAVKKEEFAAEKLIWEAEDEARRIQKWLGGDSPCLKETIETLTNWAASIRKQHNVTTNVNWNTLACAEAAELDDHYRQEYFVFSKKTHATTSGMLSSEKNVGRGFILETTVFILLCAAGHVVQVLPTKSPQRHMNRCTKLTKSLCAAVERKAFQKLDDEEPLSNLSG